MLTKSTEYAIRALVFIQLRNWQHKRPGVVEISRETEAPEAYIAKILQTLTKRLMLESQKGRGGGFFFAGNQSNLSLFDVIMAMEGDAFFHKCGFGLKGCHEENPCPLHEKFVGIRNKFSEIVRQETIQSLAKKVIDGNAVLNRIKIE